MLYQILAHLEYQNQVVFCNPAKAGSRVSLFIIFIVYLVCSKFFIHGSHNEIICSGRICGKVLFHSWSRIMSWVFFLKRDFLFYNVAYIDWLLERGSGASGQLFIHGGWWKERKNFIPVGRNFFFHREASMEILCAWRTGLRLSLFIPIITRKSLVAQDSICD